MRRVIHLKHGGFHVALDVDSLVHMPRMNFRKLLNLMRFDYHNAAALCELGVFLKENVVNAAAAHQKAKSEFSAGWKYVNKRSRTRIAIEALRENNRLQNAVKRTKADLISAESLLKIYNEMEIN